MAGFLGRILMNMAMQKAFDPEGEGYDYLSARAAGLGPDAKSGHWPSRNPISCQLLKGRRHPTWNLLEEGEREAGHEIQKGEDGKYYSRKKGGGK